MGIEAHERAPDVTGTGKPPVLALEDEKRPSLRTPFENAVLSAEQREAAKTGYYDSKFAYVNIPGARGSTVDGDGQKDKEKDELKSRMFAEAMKTLNLDGLDISFEDAMKHIDTLSTHSDKMMQQNIEAITVEENQIPLNPKTGKPFETNEELQEWQQTLTYDPAVQQYSIEDITYYNGVRVSSVGYQDVIDANLSLTNQKITFEETGAALERGEEISPEMEKIIADVDRNNGVVPVQEEEFNLIKDLEALSGPVDVNAGFQPVIKTAATPGFNPGGPQ